MVAVSIYLAIAVVGITVAFYIRNRKRACTLPGPMGWPIIGIFPSLSHEIFRDFAKLAKKHGDIFCCRLPAADVVVVNRYEIIDDLFRKKQGTFNDRIIFKVPDNLDIPVGFVELPYGERWKELRTFTIGVLNNPSLGDRTFEDLWNDEASQFFNHVNERHMSKAFNPRDALLHYTSNIINIVTFRKRVAYSDGQMEEFLKATLDVGGFFHPKMFFSIPAVFQNMARMNRLPIKKFQMSQLGMSKITDHCHRAIAGHERRKTSDESTAIDFVDLYMSAADNRNTEGKKTFLTKNSLQGVASNLISAGLETTSTMIGWLVLLLTKYPDVQKNLREEVNAVTGQKRLSTLSDRDSMHYVKAVLQETHRFASEAPLGVYHVTAEDAEYNGYFIPKNTHIINNLWGIHNDESIFPEPSTYKPERFINEAGEFVKNKYVVPYGIGKRSCPGEAFAQRQLFLFLTQLVQKFELLPEEGKSTDSICEDAVFNGIKRSPPELKTRFIPIEQ